MKETQNIKYCKHFDFDASTEIIESCKNMATGVAEGNSNIKYCMHFDFDARVQLLLINMFIHGNGKRSLISNENDFMFAKKTNSYYP